MYLREGVEWHPFLPFTLLNAQGDNKGKKDTAEHPAGRRAIIIS